jgi:hypothetical protein
MPNMTNDKLLLGELFKVYEELTAILRGATESTKFNFDTAHKRLMAAFLAKACKTHDAMVLLARNGFGEDAAILTRSLLNLVINARWINQAPEERIPAYIKYEHVLIARLNRKIVEDPRLVGRDSLDPRTEFKNKQAGLDAEAREAEKRHGYNHHGWSGKSIRDMAIELGMTIDYDSLYTLASDLEHSDVASVDDYMTLSPDGRVFVSGNPSENWVRESLFSAHLLLIAIAKLADNILDLGIGAQLVTADEKVLGLVGARRSSTWC